MIRKGPAPELITTNRLMELGRAQALEKSSMEAPQRGVAAPGKNGAPPAAEAACKELTCPTRVSPVPVLISHRIAPGECQKRQRELYHKCWDCAFSNRHGGQPPKSAEPAVEKLQNGRPGLPKLIY